MLASLPLHRHTPRSSLKRLKCLVRVVKVFCTLLTQRSSASCDSSTGSVGVWVSPCLRFLNLCTALSTFAVTPINLDSELYLAGSKTDSMVALDSPATRLCDWTLFSSNAHSSGIGSTGSSRLGSKPVCNHSGPRLQSWLTANSSGVRPLEGKSAGLDEPGQ